jgi:hypothetical protein
MRIPAITPMVIESTVVINATKKEIRAPNINLANKSCPIPGSIPSGWDQLMPPNFPIGIPREVSVSGKRLRPSMPSNPPINGATMVLKIKVLEMIKVGNPNRFLRKRRQANCRGVRPITLATTVLIAPY